VVAAYRMRGEGHGRSLYLVKADRRGQVIVWWPTVESF